MGHIWNRLCTGGAYSHIAGQVLGPQGPQLARFACYLQEKATQTSVMAKPIRYADAGVDIDEGSKAVERIKSHAASTMTARVLSGIGSFGAGYELKGFKRPVLVSSADGVGTKLKVAQMAGIHNTVGEDLVNHCVNDILVQGATPLFFLDYFATGKLDSFVAEQVVSGLAKACRENKMSLIGGETAEMPGMYAPGEYDIAGFIVGAVEKNRLLTGEKIKAGDVLLAFPSTGLHTNGYSLARKLFFEVAGFSTSTYVPELECTASHALLRVHRSYLKPLSKLMKENLAKGAAHITGGGITDNTPRMLPKNLTAVIDLETWKVPRLFTLLREIGDVPEDDWLRTFNIGVGMIVAVAKKDVAEAEELLKKMKEPFWRIGHVTERRSRGPQVIYK
jgi:phosphoribosylformylglycinamidine cyclo-ligase